MPISYRAKTDKWILLQSGSNFLFLLVDKRNRGFFPQKFSQGVEMSFFKNVNPNIYRWHHTVSRKKVIWTPWDNFSGKNSLFHLSTHKNEALEPLRSKIHLPVFPLYERGVAGHTHHTGTKRSELSCFHKSFSPHEWFHVISGPPKGGCTSTLIWRLKHIYQSKVHDGE